MNGINPTCDKTPIRAALEDTIVVFFYTFLAAIATVVIVDVWEWKMLVLPVVLAGSQGIITYARVRGIVLPAKKEEKE